MIQAFGWYARRVKIVDLAFIRGPMAESVVSLSTHLPKTAALSVARTDAPPGGRIPVLDGLRGIAVLLVMMFHSFLFLTEPGNALWELVYSRVAGLGWIGVDLFFVLSGFLITGILYDSRNGPHYYRVFYARRAVRIFPLYYASLALFFWVIPFILELLHYRGFADTYNSPLAQLLTWTYLVNWYEGLKGFNVLSLPLQHFWSLAIEEQFYLAWPFLVLNVARRRLMALCGGLMALGFVLRMVLYQIHLPYAPYTWTLCRTDALAIGAIVALCARDPRDWKKLVNWAPLLAFPALCAFLVLQALNPESAVGPGRSPNFFMGTFGTSMVGIFFGGCLVMAVCLRQGSRMHRFLGSSFLRFFGTYSYCLYVCHQPLLVVFEKTGIHSNNLMKYLPNKFLAVLAVNGFALVVTIAIAFASWHLFEKHWLKLKDLPFLQREDRPVVGVMQESGTLASAASAGQSSTAP